VQVVSVILIFWQWVTPIFLEEKQFPDKAHLVVVLNPITYVVRCYRDVLLSARPPDLRDLTILFGISLTVFVLGGLFFRHMKRGFADVL
jgi:ABC-type polysaccharide/polyol phosphate export permease